MKIPIEVTDVIFKHTVYTRIKKGMCCSRRGLIFTVLVLWLLNLFSLTHTVFLLLFVLTISDIF